MDAVATQFLSIQTRGHEVLAYHIFGCIPLIIVFFPCTGVNLVQPSSFTDLSYLIRV